MEGAGKRDGYSLRVEGGLVRAQRTPGGGDLTDAAEVLLFK